MTIILFGSEDLLPDFFRQRIPFFFSAPQDHLPDPFFCIFQTTFAYISAVCSAVFLMHSVFLFNLTSYQSFYQRLQIYCSRENRSDIRCCIFYLKTILFYFLFHCCTSFRAKKKHCFRCSSCLFHFDYFSLKFLML